MNKTEELIGLEHDHGTQNYHPLPVVIASAEGAWATDVEGRRYLDALSGYSALNFGHRHPRLVAAAKAKLDVLTLTSRAFHSDELGPFCAELSRLAKKERVLPMNTGAEAVETGIKVARKWGYQVKKVAEERATIIVCNGNFHGRTTTIVSFSDDPVARGDYGPYTPGFRSVPYGSAEAIAEAIDETTVAVLFEPIQGEAGVILPPEGYLGAVRELTRERGVLMIADEIQVGLGRTGETFACQHEEVEPDLYLLGKALGGGVLPLSAVVGSSEVLGLLRPGEHGSTFAGNPLACAVGREVVAMLSTGEFQRRAASLGERLLRRLERAELSRVADVRGRGLLVGIELAAGQPPARVFCERLLERGILAKDTHGVTIRLAPPLVVAEEEVDWLADEIIEVLREDR